MPKKISVKFDTSPLTNAHRARGIGVYTQMLQQALAENEQVELVSQARQADLIHYPFFDLFFNTLPLKLGQKIVVTIHDVTPLVFPQAYKPGMKGYLRFLAQLAKLKLVSAIITDSKHSKKDIMNYLKVPFEKIHPIYLAPNPSIQLLPEKKLQSVARRYHLPKSYLLYVGDINYNKNIPFLIKALKYLPFNFKLVLVGKNFRPQPIPEWAAIEKQIALSDVQKRVKFLTNVDSAEDLSAIYSQSLVYVNASLYEGFGLPILEAMRAKTVVISFDNSSIPEIAADKVIYLRKREAEHLAEVIKTVADWTKIKRKKWTNEAFHHSQQFTWQKTVQATVAIYEQVVHRSKP